MSNLRISFPVPPLTMGMKIVGIQGPPGSGGGGGGVSDGDKGDITVSGSGATWTIDAKAVTLPKMADMATDSFLGRDTAGTGAPEVLTPTQARGILNVADGANAYVHPDHFGDIISDGDGATAIADGAVDNAKLADMDTARVKGRVTAGAGEPEDLTGAQVLGMLPIPGTTGEVLFNTGGALAAAADVEIEGGQLRLPVIATPASPAAGGVKLFGRSIAGRLLPAFVGPAGLDSSLQPLLGRNKIFMILPANTTTVDSFGGIATVGATASHVQTIDSSNRWLATRKIRFQTTTVAGNAAGVRTGYQQWFLGSAAGRGGFTFLAQFGMNINLNGGQKFVGLTSQSAILGGDPSAQTNIIGVGYDAADASTGNWFLIRRAAGAAVKVDLGVNAARNTTDGYELAMFCAPGGSEIQVVITNLTTGILVLDATYSSAIPVGNAGLAFKCDARNGAVAAADNIELAIAYIESDY